MAIADRAQPLQIALRRRQHAGRAGHRLNDHGGNCRSVVQRDDALKLISKMRAPLRLAFGEGLMLAAIGRRQVIDAAEKRAEEFAIVDDAANRNTAKTDAMIAALAADQPRAAALPAHIMISERNFERRVDRLRSRIAEEHAIEIAGR